jgi:MOSC domain-containing protein YiiM
MSSIIKNIELHITKGEPPVSAESAKIIAGGGIEGDRHCNDDSKQISVTGADVLEWMADCETPGVCFKKFGANIVFDSIPDEMLKEGLLLKAGEATVKVEAVHKKCHASECKYFDQIADCKLRKYVLYAGGVTEGIVSAGDEVVIAGKEGVE